jgi:hypothetical protein
LRQPSRSLFRPFCAGSVGSDHFSFHLCISASAALLFLRLRAGSVVAQFEISESHLEGVIPKAVIAAG